MRICPKCNKTYDDSWGVCLKCGTKLITDMSAYSGMSGVDEKTARDQKELFEIYNTIETLKQRAAVLEKGLLSDEKTRGAVKEAVQEKGKDAEQFIAKTLFSIVGVFLFVIGAAVMGTALFACLTIIEKLGACYAGAIGLLVGGHLIERKPKFVNYGRVMIGGGWALAYFLTYILSFVPAAQLVTNPTLGLALLIGVAIGTIVDLYRYRSELAACFAYFMMYVTLMVVPVSVCTLLVIIPITVSLIFFMKRFKWYGFTLYGMVMTYVTYLKYFGISNVAFTIHQFVSLQSLVLANWLIFVIAAFLIKDEDKIAKVFGDLAIGYREAIHTVNCLAATAASMFLFEKGLAQHLPYMFAAASGLYLIITGLSFRSKQKASCILTSSFAIAFACTFLAYIFTGGLLVVAYIFVAEAIFLAGVRFKETYWRMLGFIFFVGIMVQIVFVDRVFIKNILAITNPVARALFPAFIFAIYPLNHFIYAKRVKRDHLATAETTLLTGIMYSYPAILAMGVWLDLPKVLTAPAWLILAIMFLQGGVLKDSAHFRIQGYILSVGAFVRLIMSNMTIAGGISIVSYRLLTVVPVLMGIYYLQMLSDDELAAVRIKGKEAGFHYAYPLMIFSGIMLLIRYEAASVYVAPVWAAVALIYAAAGIYTKRDSYFLAASVAAIFAAGREAFVDLGPAKYLTGAQANILMAVMTALILYAADIVYMRFKARVSDIGKTMKTDTFRMVVKSSRPVFGFSAALVVAAILFVKLTGFKLTLGWGAQAVALLSLGFMFKERNWRYCGLVLLCVSVLKVFLVDYIRVGGGPFSALIFLGILLLIISGVYYQVGDKIKKAM